MANMLSGCSAMAGNELAPLRPETPANLALRPDFSRLAAGTFDRFHGLIQSNYSASSRRSMKTTIRSFARHCVKPRLQCSGRTSLTTPRSSQKGLRGNDPNDLARGSRSRNGSPGRSTAEGHFSLMKGWHSSIMGYAPAHSGVFVSRWIPKILRGIRREFPSKLKAQ